MSVGLLEQQSTGGAIARVGFEYQDAFVLQHLPTWLAQGAFSHVVSEAVGDVEVCYFTAGGGHARVFYEAKNDVLTAGDFWKELERFMEVHAASPQEYLRFVLVCRDYNAVTSPLVRMVQRLRGVGSSFPADSPVLVSDRATITQWVVDKNKPQLLAEFVLERVDFVSYSSDSADQAFAGEMAARLSSIDLTAKATNALRDRFKELIRQSSQGPVTRQALESELDALPGAEAWRSASTAVIAGPDDAHPHELQLDAHRFVSDDRHQRTSAEWSDLARDLERTSAFIKASRQRRTVLLDAKMRMTMAAMFGLTFSATRGFVLELTHNGSTFRTDIHARASEPFFEAKTTDVGLGSAEGVVCIGFPTAVGEDVLSTAGASLADLPRLTLSSQNVIDGQEPLNTAVWEAKAAMTKFRSDHALQTLHILVKAPSMFALVLGHRLNGLGQLQFYDWVGGRYIATLRHVPT